MFHELVSIRSIRIDSDFGARLGELPRTLFIENNNNQCKVIFYSTQRE